MKYLYLIKDIPNHTYRAGSSMMKATKSNLQSSCKTLQVGSHGKYATCMLSLRGERWQSKQMCMAGVNPFDP